MMAALLAGAWCAVAAVLSLLVGAVIAGPRKIDTPPSTFVPLYKKEGKK